MKEHILDNGLTILTENIESAKSATISYFVNAGSYDEVDYPAGIAHYIEHLLFKGTTTRDANQINEDIDNIGGIMNAYTDYEKTKYYVVVPYDQWKVGLDVVSDLVWNHTIPQEELEKERTVILEEIKMYNDDPSSVAYDELHKAMHQNQAERQSIIGTPQSVKSVTREDIMRFIDQYYQPDNIVLVVTGNINEEEIIDFVKNYNITRNGESKKVDKVFKANDLKSDTVSIARDIEQAHFTWGLFAPAISDPDAYAIDVLSNIMGGGMSSRLYRLIREEQGLAYRVSVGYHALNDSGFINGYVGLEPSKIDEVKDIVINEFERLTKELVSEAELKKAIANLCGTFMIKLERASSLNDYHGNCYLSDTSTDPDDYVDKVRKVTAEDILSAAQKYIKPDNWQFVQVVPK